MPARIDVDSTNRSTIGAMFEMVRVPIKGTPTDFGDVTTTCRGGASCPPRIDVDGTNRSTIGAMFEMRVPIKGTPTDFGNVTITCRGGALCPPASMSILLDFMTYDPEKHHRRSIRLKGFDYSRSAIYFITICVQNRKCLFGTISQNQLLLNDAGKMVLAEWLQYGSVKFLMKFVTL